MALISNMVWGIEDKVAIAIDRLREFEPEEGYYLAFSGGKDSQAVYELAMLAEVRFDAHYSITTVDPPELVRFIQSEYPGVARHVPARSMWQLIPEHGIPPTQRIRYCCRVLKESGGAGRRVVTGVRWQESNRRRLRRMTEVCHADSSRAFVHPIIDWSEKDVWQFLKQVVKKPYCTLYDEGFTRLGCIGCPMGNKQGMQRQFDRWPKYRQAYIRAFERLIEERRRKGLKSKVEWSTGEQVMAWWIRSAPKVHSDQTILFE